MSETLEQLGTDVCLGKARSTCDRVHSTRFSILNKTEYQVQKYKKSDNLDDIIKLDISQTSHEVKNLRINSDNKFEAEIVPIGP